MESMSEQIQRSTLTRRHAVSSSLTIAERAPPEFLLGEESKNPDRQPVLAACPVGRERTPSRFPPLPPPSVPSTPAGLTVAVAAPPQGFVREESKNPIRQPLLAACPVEREQNDVRYQYSLECHPATGTPAPRHKKEKQQQKAFIITGFRWIPPA